MELKLKAIPSLGRCLAMGCLLALGFVGCGEASSTTSAPVRHNNEIIVATIEHARIGRPNGDESIVVATTGHSAPYAMQDALGEFVGSDVELVRAAAKEVGRPIRFEVMPFENIIPALRTGHADVGIGSITILEHRRRDVDFSDPNEEQGCAFLYRAGEVPPTIIRAEDIVVGVVDSTTGETYLSNHQVDSVRYPNYKALFEAFVREDVATIFGDLTELQASAEASGGKYLVTPRETREFYGIAIRRGSDMAAFRAALNRAIAARRAK